MKKLLGSLLLLAVTSSAYAGSDGLACEIEHLLGWVSACHSGSGGGKPVAAPEMDPASATAALTLVMGGLAVLRGRRRPQSK